VIKRGTIKFLEKMLTNSEEIAKITFKVGLTDLNLL
jgi:hypothetical protein